MKMNYESYEYSFDGKLAEFIRNESTKEIPNFDPTANAPSLMVLERVCERVFIVIRALWIQLATSIV